MCRGNQVICHSCKEKFYKDELTYVNKSKRLCCNCIETTQREAEDYKILVKYICDGFKIKAPTGQQMKKIKEFKELGYSYKDIQYTLYYIYGVTKRKIEGTSIGLVPFYFEKAMEHKRLIEVARENAKLDASVEIEIENNIDIHQPRKRKTRIIDIVSII